MDVDLEKRINETIESMQQILPEAVDIYRLDPMAKIMLVALVSETAKIQDYADGTLQRIVERFCTDFIPRKEVNAMPAICLIQPQLNADNDNPFVIETGASFEYKSPMKDAKLKYIPIFNTTLLPYKDLYLLNHRQMSYRGGKTIVNIDRPNTLWIGITTPMEVNMLKGLSIMLKGTKGIVPEHVYAGADCTEIDFATMSEMEKIEMADPFDAQQVSGNFFSFIENWKENLQNISDVSLLYITDSTKDRDIFKHRAYPRMFQKWLENETLDLFKQNTIWLRLDFPDGYVVPDDCTVSLGVVPVTNIEVNNVMLTQAQPIVKLQGEEDSFFLDILETSTASNRQGFSMNKDDIIVRDFEANCYNNGDLYRDVRNLYNRFIDDYYAFIEYNGIKDGEVLKKLRETINKLGKGVGMQNRQFMYDSGTYVMKNMDSPTAMMNTSVRFITTKGVLGNSPRVGEMMECKNLPGVEQKTSVVVSGMGGTDKASADERYELLRYYSLTNDRLFTRMDIDAFLRKEIIAEYGKEEFNRIYTKISVEGIGGEHGLRRGLYIDISFKDRNNYEHAVKISFDTLIRQRIQNKSCISMPIIVTLKNLDN